MNALAPFRFPRLIAAILLAVFGLVAAANAQTWTQVYSGSGTLYSEDNGEGGWNNSSDYHSFTLSASGSIRVNYSGTVSASVYYTTPANAGGQGVTVQCEGTGEGGNYTITVDYLPSPTAHIANRWTAKAGVPVMLNGSGSTGAANIVSYAWDINNDGTIEATGATPSLSFPSPFPYSAQDITVKLTVTDAYGGTGSTTRSVTVRNQDAVQITVQNGGASWGGLGPETPFWSEPYQDVTLTANPPSGGAPYSAGWKVNSGTIAGINPVALSTTGTLSTSDVNISATYGPSTPTNLSFGTVAYNSIALTWSAATDNVAVTNYDVYRAAFGYGFSLEVLVGTVGGSTTTFVDTHVASSTQYGYVVRARDAEGNSSGVPGFVWTNTPAPPDTDSDGVPDVLETTFGIQSNANASGDTNLGLKINRPIP